jgi:hypothetical protein
MEEEGTLGNLENEDNPNEPGPSEKSKIELP